MKMKIILLFLLIFQFNFSQNQPIKPNNPDPEWEIWQEEVPISGNVRVGLMVGQGKEEKVNPKHFYAIIPEYKLKEGDPLTKRLCVELSSKDGRYSAKISYTINLKNFDKDKRKHIGIQEFELPTKYKNELSNLNADELVILASLSDDCSTSPEAYVLASWFKIEKMSSIDVYLNSIMPTRVALKSGDGITGTPIQCESLKLPAIAYSKKGRIKSVSNLKDNSIIYIQQRRKRGTKSKIVKYKIPLRYYEIGT